jgi:hypothetical protein
MSLPHGRGHASQDVQLMRDVQECSLLRNYDRAARCFDLRNPLGNGSDLEH